MEYPTLKIAKPEPKPKNEIARSNLVKITCKICEPRTGGEFADKAYWLDDDYDWQIGRDNRDQLILVATKKSKCTKAKES